MASLRYLTRFAQVNIEQTNHPAYGRKCSPRGERWCVYRSDVSCRAGHERFSLSLASLSLNFSAEEMS